MEANQVNINPFENFTGREVYIILENHLLSSKSNGDGVKYIYGKIIKVYPRFILLKYGKKEILINVDNILGIEE